MKTLCKTVSRAAPSAPATALRKIVSGAALIAAGLSLWGCPTEKGYPPVARMRIDPAYVPVNTPTDVLLDGKRSCDEVDHPEGCDKSADGSGPTSDCPAGVTFQWTLDRDVQLLGGGPNQPWMQVRVNTDRPVNVTLRVTDCDGERGEVRGQIGVTLPFPDASVSPGPDAGI